MADASHIAEIADANFDLLSPSDDLSECLLEEEVTQEELEAVQDVVMQTEAQNAAENDNSLDDFQDPTAHGRHAMANAAKLDFYADANHRDTTKKQTKWAVTLFTGNYTLFSQKFVSKTKIKYCSRRQKHAARWSSSATIFLLSTLKSLTNKEMLFLADWLITEQKDTNFESLPDTLLAEILRQFFAEVRNKEGKPYSKSGMVNITSGLNRYLQSHPHNRIINLMNDKQFQNANKVFTGVLHINKQNGLDVRKPKVLISREDITKLYDEYPIPGLSTGNTEILPHKVFFDVVYYLSRRAKKGLRALRKDSFEFLKTPDGTEYIQIAYNKVSKKN